MNNRTKTRADATRAILLDAARSVFVAHGYVDTTVTAIVERAGASVGSLYHHFGGKPDVFIALYEEFERRANLVVSTAVAMARDSGVVDPIDLFAAGARDYLQFCRDERDLATLFLHGDGPPGFHVLQRRTIAEWVRKNARLIRADERRNGEALVVILTTTVTSAAREVAHCDDDERSVSLIDDLTALLRRIAAP